MGIMDDFRKREKERLERRRRIEKQIKEILRIPFEKRPAVYIFVDPSYTSQSFFGIISKINKKEDSVLLRTQEDQKELLGVKINQIVDINVHSTINLVDEIVFLRRVIERKNENIKKGIDIILG